MGFSGNMNGRIANLHWVEEEDMRFGLITVNHCSHGTFTRSRFSWERERENRSSKSKLMGVKCVNSRSSAGAWVERQVRIERYVAHTMVKSWHTLRRGVY